MKPKVLVAYKKLIAVLGIGLAVFIMSGGSAEAASLTSTQVSAIVSLLRSFGADASTVAKAQTALSGGAQQPCLTLQRNLSIGSVGNDVNQLQQFLDISATGYFDLRTQQAVKEWQSRHSIPAEGEVGPITRTALRCNVIPPGNQYNGPTFYQVSTEPAITVSGNELLANGQPFQVKGLMLEALMTPAIDADIMAHGISTLHDGYQHININPDGLDNLINAITQVWSANTLRMAVWEPYLDPQASILTPAEQANYTALINKAVSAAVTKGLAVIIVMNRVPWQQHSLQEESTWRAWQALLPVLKNNPSVMPDLTGEPDLHYPMYTGFSDSDWSVWKYGGAYTSPQGVIRTALGMQILVNRIRSAGVTNVLVVEPLGFTRVDTNPDHLVQDPLGQTAYAIHPYVNNFFQTSNVYGLSEGGAFSTSTNKTIFDAAFGNAAQSLPVIADEYDLIQTSGPGIACQDIPRTGYFVAAYFQKYLAGGVGYSLNDVPYLITSDWNYTPRGYADISQCGTLNADWTSNIGDIGSILSSWYHGVDLWGSTVTTVPTITIDQKTPGTNIGGDLYLSGTSNFSNVRLEIGAGSSRNFPDPNAIYDSSSVSVANDETWKVRVPGSIFTVVGTYTVDVGGPEGSDISTVTSVPLTVTSASTLATNSSLVAPGGSVTVSWGNVYTDFDTWIGLFKKGDPFTNDSMRTTDWTWAYLNCTKTIGYNSPVSGSCSFTIPPDLPSGTYIFEIFGSNNLHDPILQSNDVVSTSSRPT